MKIFVVLWNFETFLSLVGGVTYLRPQNDRGPGAVKAGVSCIEQVERGFFENKYSEQVQNLAVFHSLNMTTPASEIEGEYLFGLHDRLINHEEGEKNFQLRVINEIAEKSGQKSISLAYEILTDFYVVVADSLTRARLSIRSISFMKSFNEEAKFLFLINNPDERDGGEIIAQKLLEAMFTKHRAVNVVVMYGTNAFSYDIYTGNPYHGSTVECGKMEALRIGKCSSGKIEEPEKTLNFLQLDKVPETMGDCVFKICARVQEPFVNEGCRDGLEINILELLQEEMGFRANITCSELDRGEPNEDGTWSDLLGEVRDDACDIIVGAFFPDHVVHNVFAPTEFYLQDFYTFYVAKAELAPRWKGLIIIFKIWAWTAFGVVLIVSWISWVILGRVSSEAKQHQKIVLTFMNVLSVTLGISANNRPSYPTLRVFFCMLALYALTINAIYTSKLIQVFTNPKYNYQIDSLEELLESELPIGGRWENMDWFENEDEIDLEIFRRYNHSDPFRPSTSSLQRVKNGKMSIIASKLFVRSNKYRNDVFGLSRSMFSNHLEMIVERGFPLLRRINEILAMLRDAGLMNKLFIDFQFNMTILVPMREVRDFGGESVEFDIDDDDENSDTEEKVTVLTYEHLEGAYSALYAGLIVSGGVFILEIIYDSETFKKIIEWMKIKIFCRKKDNKKRKIVPVKSKKIEIKKVQKIRWAPHVEYKKFKAHKA